jgi:hypothetical protein
LTLTAHSPALTQLSEEENLFYTTVRQFAEEKIAPFVRTMDDEQHLAPGLVEQLFELGLMGIEIPEELGGAGGSFFDSVLAIEALSTVDPGVAVLVDVHNTLVVNALLRWGTEEQRRKWLPRLAADTAGAYALSEAGSGSDAFALQTRAVDGCRRLPAGRTQAVDQQRARGGTVHRLRHARSGGGLQGHHRISGGERRAGIHRGAQGRQAGDSRQQHL